MPVAPCLVVGAARHQRRVVYENVDRAQGRLREKPVNAVLSLTSQGEAEHVRAHGPQTGGGFFQRRFHVTQGKAPAVGGQRLRDGTAQAARRAGDHAHFSVDRPHSFRLRSSRPPAAREFPENVGGSMIVLSYSRQ
jgi:hypothetical protein